MHRERRADQERAAKNCAEKKRKCAVADGNRGVFLGGSLSGVSFWGR